MKNLDPFYAGIVAELPTLTRYAFRYVNGNRAAAQDLVQDTFVRAIERRHLFDGTNIGGWLHTILRNLACDSARRSARHTLVSVDDATKPDVPHQLPAVTPAQEDVVMVKETMRLFSRLTIERQRAVQACVFDELSYEEARTSLGINRGTLRSRVSRGRAQIAKLCGVAP